MTQIFDNYKLVEIVPQIGEQFDPLKHSALFEMEAPPGSLAKPGTVAAVVKRGFKRNEVLIRPASVAVVKPPS